jgi:hypothetical protein
MRQPPYSAKMPKSRGVRTGPALGETEIRRDSATSFLSKQLISLNKLGVRRDATRRVIKHLQIHVWGSELASRMMRSHRFRNVARLCVHP